MLADHSTNLTEVQARKELLQEDDLCSLSMRFTHERLCVPQILLEFSAANTQAANASELLCTKNAPNFAAKTTHPHAICVAATFTVACACADAMVLTDRKSTRLNSSH